MKKERIGALQNISWNQIVGQLLQEFYEQKNRKIIKRLIRIPKISGKINAFIGMRRTGKTYLLYQEMESLLAQGVDQHSIFYLNFEDDRLPSLSPGSLAALIDGFYELYPENHARQCYLFLDEVQNASDWSKVLRRLLDTRQIQLTITGSSAKLLSKELETSLRGRSLATEVWPFSFLEYSKARSIPLPAPPHSFQTADLIRQNLTSYLKEGGFPETLGLESIDRRRIHQDYVSVVILKDIIERYRIKNEAVLRYLIKILLAQIARPISINKIYSDLKSQGRPIGKNTLYQYLDLISDCFLAFTIPIFSESVRKQQSNPRKIYCVDPGLSQSHTLSVSENLGRLFENLIYLDLKRTNHQISYYLTRSGYEVDFVAEGADGTLRLIQVCWQLDDASTLERESRALREAEVELNLKGLIVTPNNYLEFLGTIQSGATSS